MRSRGFLTGKVKRDQVPTEGRLGWAAKDQRLKLQSHPNWEMLNKESNWSVLEAVEKVAKAKGERILLRCVMMASCDWTGLR